MDKINTTSWDWIRSYIAVAERGSVLAAAQHLQTNPSTVSRHVVALEKSLGLELFVRSRQGMRPSLPAMQFLEHARAMQSAMYKLSLGAASKDQQAHGLVRISASVTLAHFVLPRLLDVFRSLHSHISIELTATDSVSNLSQREADIAIRLMKPVQEDLIAKRVGYFHVGLFASQHYIDRRGIPKMQANSLIQHDFIDVSPQYSLRNGFVKAGFPQVAERIFCTVTDHANGWHLLRAGLGVGAGLSILAAHDSQLVSVLPETETPKFPIWLVTHKEVKNQPRLRLVLDYLGQALKSLSS